MKTLIAYASKSGTTAKCTQILKQKLTDTDVINVQTESVDLSGYDTIIIGGAIRYGRINKKVHQFVEEHLAELLRKDVALFICCGFPEQIEQRFTDNFPKELLEHAFLKENFGGELNPGALGFFEKIIAKMAMRAAKTEEQPKILLDHIDHFAHEIQVHTH